LRPITGRNEPAQGHHAAEYDEDLSRVFRSLFRRDREECADPSSICLLRNGLREFEVAARARKAGLLEKEW